MSSNIDIPYTSWKTNVSYRPRKFSQVVGQQVAVKLITSALQHEKLPRAIILYGPSGVGKTTIARLVAAWYVCQARTDDVCGECSMCQAVQDGTISDILEFDAASNTSIEDIRQILDQCEYAPQYSSQKVFIIDEAHMLSRNAIAALLKTLEEAPDHVRFILATTELEKIPNAIASRCLCVALHNISSMQMKDYFVDFAKIRKIKIGDDAINLLVRLSNGSMREGISIFNQAILLASTERSNGLAEIDAKLLHAIVSYVDDEKVESLVQLISQKKFVEVFDAVNNLLLHDHSNGLSLLSQVIDCVKNICTNTDGENRVQYIKILIDLNKLQQDATKYTCFDQMVAVGLAQIAYEA